jgi:microsomal dipeptidase-like Zn-dependent dipeptidase
MRAIICALITSGVFFSTKPEGPAIETSAPLTPLGESFNHYASTAISFGSLPPYNQLSSEGRFGPDGAVWGVNSLAQSLGPIFGDVNGDGKADVVYWVPNVGYKVLLSTGSTFVEQAGVWGINTQNQDLGPFLADVNGDGKADIVYWSSGIGYRVLLSNGSGFGPDTQFGINTIAQSKGPWLADVNGDGKADIVYWAAGIGYRVLLSTGSSFGTDMQWGVNASNQDMGPWLGDIDGDGKADVVFYNTSQGFRWLRSTGNNSFSSESGCGGFLSYTPSKGPFLADINGDGKADLVYWLPYIGYRVLININGNFEPDTNTTWGSNRQNQDLGPFLADVNGDHRADLIYWHSGEGYHALLSNSQSIEGHGLQLYNNAIVIVAHHHSFRTPSNTNLSVLQQNGVTAAVVKLVVDGVDWSYNPSVPGAPNGEWSRVDIGLNLDQANYNLFTNYYTSLANNLPQNVIIAQTVQDIRNAKAAGKLAVIIGSEGAKHLDSNSSGSVSNMQAQVTNFYNNYQWRETQLLWAVAQGTSATYYGGNLLWSGSYPNVSLNQSGVAVLNQLAATGVVIDVSHLSDVGGSNTTAFYNVMQNLSNLSNPPPVIKSHDTPASFGGESTDDMIVKVANSGGGNGVFALVFNSRLLTNSTYSNYSLLFQLVMAAEYVINLLGGPANNGANHVAIGGDYLDDDYVFAVEPTTGNPPKDIPDDPTTLGNSYPQASSNLPLVKFAQALVHRGLTDNEVNAIIGGNVLNLYSRVWK